MNGRQAKRIRRHEKALVGMPWWALDSSKKDEREHANMYLSMLLQEAEVLYKTWPEQTIKLWRDNSPMPVMRGIQGGAYGV